MADIECPRCGGQGVITEYLHVKEGVCFLCWGDGILYDDNSPKLAAIKAIQARMEIQRRLAASPKHHRWQGLLLTCLIDGEEEHFVVSTDNINVPEDVMTISPETPLAKALDRLELHEAPWF